SRSPTPVAGDHRQLTLGPTGALVTRSRISPQVDAGPGPRGGGCDNSCARAPASWFSVLGTVLRWLWLATNLLLPGNFMMNIVVLPGLIDDRVNVTPPPASVVDD